jgi:hypothetical protein
MKATILKSWIAALALAGGASAQAGVVLNFGDFSSTAGLTINGNAAQVGNVLRVTPAIDGQAGSVFSTSPVSLASGASFSTYFQFRFSSPDTGFCDGQGCGADGLVFVVQTVANNVGGAGGGIGYFGIPKSVGIEFDSWYNGELGDIDSNHVGIDLNGNIVSTVQKSITEADLNDGDIWNAWVDYDSATSNLEVRLTRSNARPATAFLSYTVDLASVLGSTNAFVGFTSGTGASHANHDLLSWQLADSFDPIDPNDPGTVPLPGSLPLLGLGLAALGLRGRRRAPGAR